LLFASVPLAVALRASVPAVPEEQFVYVKVAVAPPAMVCDVRPPVQLAIATGVTAFAAAVPVFLTVSVAVNVCAVSTVEGLGAKDTAVRAAAA
jgi:hypothetical protein